MKLIIAGSRTFDNYELLKAEVNKFLSELKEPFPTIISGMSNGADKLGVLYAVGRSLELIKMPANWDLYGKSAGYKRNEEMAKIADACIVFWDGISKGTQHMINIMGKYPKNLKIIYI